MDRLIYTAMTGAKHVFMQQAGTANNLANASTVGFKAQEHRFRAVPIQSEAMPTRAFVVDASVADVFDEGPLMFTGRNLDVAVQGDALLVVQAKNGEEAYTRRGDLQLSPSGLLTTGDGSPVQGAQGPVTIPPADSISIDTEGRVWVVPTGGDPQSPQEVDRLRLATPAGSNIVKGLDGLFRVKGGGILPDDPEARLVTRSIEGSNVAATTALVEMIEASRSWDTQLKMITDARDMDSATANLMQLPR